MAAPTTNGKSGCGVVTKVVDRDRWVTISSIALPVRVGTAMTAVPRGESLRNKREKPERNTRRKTGST